MKTSFISSAAISQAAKLSLQKAEAQLVKAQKEVASGRHADVGLALGNKTGQVVSLRQEYSRLETIIDTNSSVQMQLEASQASLQSLSDMAGEFVSVLVATRGGEQNADNAIALAENDLAAFTDLSNASINGKYLFAGINTDTAPITNYFETPTPANNQAVDNAFLAEFGFDQSNAAVSTITPAAMQSFLDGAFATLFEDPAWSDWSSASDQNIRSRISTSEIVDTSTSADGPAFRKLAAAYTMVADLGAANMNDDTFETVIDAAIQTAQEAIDGIATAQSNLGLAQQSVTSADERMTVQRDIITEQIGTMEEVDPYEASTTLNNIIQQVELSYAITARINQLSILNYL